MNYQQIIKFIALIESVNKIFSPQDILFIGSFSRGEMSGTSDLDIRLFHNSGFIDSLKAYVMATLLRALGLALKFPIDIFCFSNINFLDKINKNEIPVNFMRNELILEKYPKSKNYSRQIKKLVIR